MDNKTENGTLPPGNIRALKLLFLYMIVFIMIFLRLFYLQIIRHDFYLQISLKQRLDTITLSPDRGDIYDRNGNLLATSINAFSVGAAPSEMKNKWEVANALSGMLNESRSGILEKLDTDKSFVWIKRKIEAPLAKKIEDKNLPGIRLLPEKKRVYPKKRLASQILGFVGVDNQALAGIELSFDKFLKGEEGKLRYEKDVFGRDILTSNLRYLNSPTNGMDLTLTIDESLQYKAEAEIMKAVRTSKAKSGCAVVMDVKTGEILALASYPDFDPNDYRKYSENVWNNHAITDVYEPGSTFKLVTVACGIENGAIKKGSKVYCPSSIEIGGRVIKNSHKMKFDTNYLSVAEILRESVNTGAAEIAIKAGKDRFYRCVKDFGFGESTGVGLPGESRGILYEPSKWNKPDLAMMSFGQTIAVTPIQLISGLSAIANNGIRVRPILVKKIESYDGSFIKVYATQRAGYAVSQKTARDVLELSESVVEEGTGRLAKIPYFRVGGKTGTAQKPKPGGGYLAGHYVSSFIGFVPLNDPKIAVLIVVDDPETYYWGERIAAPVFKQVAEYALRRLNIAPDKKEASVI